MISVGVPSSSVLAADIVFRYLQRLSQALSDRLERLEPSGANPIKTAGAETKPARSVSPSRG